jgi:hypothetical protein
MKKALLVACAAVVLGINGCNTAAPVSVEAIPPGSGHYWVVGVVWFCPTPNVRPGCPILPTQSQFDVLTRLTVPGGYYRQVAQIRTSDGAVGYVEDRSPGIYPWSNKDQDAELKSRIAAMEGCIRSLYSVKIGDTERAVQAAMPCKPDHINTTVTAAGAREQWVFEFLSKNFYLYFENGRLAAKQI